MAARRAIVSICCWCEPSPRRPRPQHLPLVTRAADALGVTDAVEVGSTCIQYNSLRSGLPDAVIDRMVRQGTCLDASLAEGTSSIEPALTDLMRAFHAGVPLVLGSDAGSPRIPYGASLHRELQLWVQ